MLTIRLQRRGKKNQPFFKIIVTEEKNSSTRGRSVEQLGFYNPLTKERSLNGDRAKYWMSVGAQPSDTVYNMLITDNIIEGKKRLKHKKSKKKDAEAKAGPTAAAPKESAAEEPAKAKEVKDETTTPKEESEATPESQPEEQPQPESAPVKEEEPQLKTDEPGPEAREDLKKDTQTDK